MQPAFWDLTTSMRKFAIVLAVVVIGLGVGYLTACPCGPVPGAWLFGDKPSSAVADWSFVNDRAAVPLCQIEVSTWRPHSVNLNCMADEGELFISCSNCADKQWSRDVQANPAAKIRAAGVVYPVEFSRVTQPSELDRAWRARLNKLQREDIPRPDHWWSFQLKSR